MRTLATLSALALAGGCGFSGSSDDGGGGGDAPRCQGLEAHEADTVLTLTSGGRERQARVHLPPGYDPTIGAPVFLDFHGYSSDATQQELVSQLDRVADELGFVAVYPEGTGLPQSWNAGACCGSAVTEDVDDVQLAADVLDALAAEVCIDPSRVYSTGLSNGGFLSHRLACELPDRIAGIAPVAGVMGVDSCDPGRPMPVIEFHGTADTVVPYNGNDLLGFPPVEDTVRGWAERNGCDVDANREVTYENGDSRCEAFAGCPEAGPVILCTVEGGGHTWPGGTPVPALGYTTTDLDASAMMAEVLGDFAVR